jgi:GNAT superfamily N-acetyltransferase
MSTEPVTILRAKGREAVPAQLHLSVTLQQLADVEAKWKMLRYQAVMEHLKAGTPRDQIPENWHWDWAAKASRSGAMGVRIMGIECEGDWQGLIMTTAVGYAARLAPDLGKPLIYVKYVESAPWNLKSMSASPKFAGIGVRLIEAGVRESLDAGFGGRLGLHALPAAHGFYQRFGFVTTGIDAAVENLPYFELTVIAAQKFLNGETR